MLVKNLIFILSALNKPELPSKLQKDLIQLFGTIDYTGNIFPFSYTTYYNQEFGENLFRFVVSFKDLQKASFLAGAKRKMIELECKYSKQHNRLFNLDIGYMDLDKLILASVKYNYQKIFLQDGIYADMLLRFLKKKWMPYAWTFADFKAQIYHDDLCQIRSKLKLALQ